MSMSMFLVLPRASQSTDADADADASSSSKTTRIVIGVVVGGVAAIAITAGIIFFLIKKRKWDRIQQCEERLLDYQLVTGYSKTPGQSRSVTPEDQLGLGMNPMSPPLPASTTTYYSYASNPSGTAPGTVPRPAPGTESSSNEGRTSTSTIDTPPPAYQTLHPRYDPSRYSQYSQHRQSIPSSLDFQVNLNFSLCRSGNANPVNVNGTGPGVPNPPNPNQGGEGSIPAWYQQQQQQFQQTQAQYRYQPDSSVSTTRAPPGSNGGSALESVAADQGRQRPRRPRPVLSRLVTNFG